MYEPLWTFFLSKFFQGSCNMYQHFTLFIIRMFLLCGSSIFICQESPCQTCSPLGSADNRPSTRPGETITKIVVLWNYPLNCSISHDALLTQPLLGKSLLSEWRSLVGRMSWKWVMWPALLDKVDQRERREREQTGETGPTPLFFPKYKCVWIHFRARGLLCLLVSLERKAQRWQASSKQDTIQQAWLKNIQQFMFFIDSGAVLILTLTILVFLLF